MNHIGTIELQTERLLLRRLEASDAQAMFSNWASDPVVTKFLRWPTHTDITVSQTVIDSIIVSYKEATTYDWGIVLQETGTLIGMISVVEIEPKISSLTIGYCIGTRWWGNGYVAEALQAVIEFLFTTVQAQRIASYHDPNNPNSGKVMRKCGLTYEGTQRKADISNQGIVDKACYSILRSDVK